jgi:uncharacterized protein YndB with AHSA1/START domain
MTIEPIERIVVVPGTPEGAFRLFTTHMGSWWPVATHALADADAGQTVERVVFDEVEGGRIYEVWPDGTEKDWGRVTTWDPPGRVAFDWNPSEEDRPFTQVEVRFSPVAEGTEIRLLHRGWERLGADRSAAMRADYVQGWAYVFDTCFGEAAAAAV